MLSVRGLWAGYPGRSVLRGIDLAVAEGEVVALIERSGRPVKCFGLTKQGQPKHPLYLRSDAELVPF